MHTLQSCAHSGSGLTTEGLGVWRAGCGGTPSLTLGPACARTSQSHWYEREQGREQEQHQHQQRQKVAHRSLVDVEVLSSSSIAVAICPSLSSTSISNRRSGLPPARNDQLIQHSSQSGKDATQIPQ